MRRRFELTVIAAISAVVLPFQAWAQGNAAPAPIQAYSDRLEIVLNDSGSSDLTGLVVPDLQQVLDQRYSRFREDFPEVTWRVEPAEPLADGRPTLLITVSGEARAEGLDYLLEARERIAVRLEAGQMQEQELLEQQSLLRSGERPLPVTLDIPDSVLTGSRYDVDLIVNEPLGKALVAGGLIDLTESQVLTQSRPNLPLEPLGGGGLFKTVQAPQVPGSQTWALMLVHPDGVVTATKRVRVVNSRSALSSS